MVGGKKENQERRRPHPLRNGWPSPSLMSTELQLLDDGGAKRRKTVDRQKWGEEGGEKMKETQGFQKIN